jgi:hypothetical protein
MKIELTIMQAVTVAGALKNDMKNLQSLIDSPYVSSGSKEIFTNMVSDLKKVLAMIGCD